VAGYRDLLPKLVQLLARAIGAARCNSTCEDHTVHGTGAGGADCVDRQPAVLDQPVEHSPGKGAMRTSTLQRKVDGLLVGAVLPAGGIRRLPCHWIRLAANCPMRSNCRTGAQAAHRPQRGVRETASASPESGGC